MRKRHAKRLSDVRSQHKTTSRLRQDASFSACKEVADRCPDLLRMSLEREVARIEEMNLRTGNVTSERLGTCW